MGDQSQPKRKKRTRPRHRNSGAIAKAAAIVDSPAAQRAATKAQHDLDLSKSKQLRFQEGGEWARSFFKDFYDLALKYHKCPSYGNDWRGRAAFTSKVWMTEPHWGGAVKTVATIDANRGWTLVGPRRQLAGYNRADGTRYPGANAVMHNHVVGVDVVGYYDGVFEAAKNYRTVDIGHINEVLRLGGPDGPAAGFVSMDPTRALLTGNLDFPLKYNQYGEIQEWGRHDYFRVSDMPTSVGGNYGYGFSATSMMLDVMKIMVAVTAYKQEKLGAKLPQGFLLAQGIDDAQFEKAMGGPKGMSRTKQRKWFGGLAVLFGGEAKLDMKLVALSQLPDNFDEQDFTEAYMYLSALILGVDPGELWPTTSRSGFGRSREAEIQAEQATAKGKKSFINRYFEQLQRELPATVSLVSDERDEKGELLAAQVKQAKATVINALWSSGLGYIDREEARSLAAEADLIPREWTEIEEDAMATDTEAVGMRKLRDRCRSDLRVLRAAEVFPNEPIMSVHYPSGAVNVLYRAGADVLRPHAWAVSRDLRPTHPARLPTVQRETLYQEGAVSITDEDVDAMEEQTQQWVDDDKVDGVLVELISAEAI